jgi:hypothetical protein
VHKINGATHKQNKRELKRGDKATSQIPTRRPLKQPLCRHMHSLPLGEKKEAVSLAFLEGGKEGVDDKQVVAKAML